MRVYDPHACTMVEMEDCDQAPALGEFVPIKSPRTGVWFAVHFPTGVSRKVETFDGGNLDELRRLIAAGEFAEAFLDACHRVEMGEQVLTEGRAETERDKALHRYGADAVDFAERRAVLEDIPREKYRAAYAFLFVPPLTEDLETIRIGDLLEVKER